MFPTMDTFFFFPKNDTIFESVVSVFLGFQSGTPHYDPFLRGPICLCHFQKPTLPKN